MEINGFYLVKEYAIICDIAHNEFQAECKTL